MCWLLKKEKAFTPKQWLGDNMTLEVDEQEATN
jgi:hypothetical protein